MAPCAARAQKVRAQLALEPAGVVVSCLERIGTQKPALAEILMQVAVDC